MSGPNNYGVKLEILLKFIHKNPQLTRNEILCRLGNNYLSAFNKAKHLKIIKPDDDSTYKRKHWIIKGGERQCGKSLEERENCGGAG